MVLFKGEITMPRSKESIAKQKIYRANYNKDREKVISLHFIAEADKDIIDKINSAPNKVGYIRELVRADIEREKQAKQNPSEK